MTTAEVFSDIVGKATYGVMLHEQLANYFSFLALDRYRQWHETEAHDELQRLFDVKRGYMTRHNKLIHETRVEPPRAIPESWERYSRPDVDIRSKRQAVRDGIEAWLTWETTLFGDLQKHHSALMANGDIADADCVVSMIRDVCKERALACKIKLALDAVDMDMAYILEHPPDEF